jgi:hypothetical protein
VQSFLEENKLDRVSLAKHVALFRWSLLVKTKAPSVVSTGSAISSTVQTSDSESSGFEYSIASVTSPWAQGKVESKVEELGIFKAK